MAKQKKSKGKILSIREKGLRRLAQREAVDGKIRKSVSKRVRTEGRVFVVGRLEEDPGLERQKQSVREAAAQKEAGKQRWDKATPIGDAFLRALQGGGADGNKRR